MSRRRLLACLGLGLLPAWWSTASRAQPRAKVDAPGQRRVALVIGNGRYPEMPLNNPEHFSYTTQCAKGPLDYVIGDARLTVSKQPRDTFDIR